MTDESEPNPTINFMTGWSVYKKLAWADKRQKNGCWVPAFPPPTIQKEEEYIEKMIKKDKEANLY